MSPRPGGSAGCPEDSLCKLCNTRLKFGKAFMDSLVKLLFRSRKLSPFGELCPLRFHLEKVSWTGTLRPLVVSAFRMLGSVGLKVTDQCCERRARVLGEKAPGPCRGLTLEFLPIALCVRPGQTVQGNPLPSSGAAWPREGGWDPGLSRLLCPGRCFGRPGTWRRPVGSGPRGFP